MAENVAPAEVRSAYLARVDHELERLRQIIVNGAIPSEVVGEIFLLGMEAHPIAGVPASVLPH